MQLAGKVIVVSGAGSGLGAAVTRMLAGEGAKVLAADIDAAAGESIAAELGSTVRFQQADVTSENDGLAVVALAMKTFGHVQGLVNCAGVASGEKVVGRDGPHRLDDFVRTVAVNLVGTFNMLRLAADAIKNEEPDEDGERGVIINTASIAAFDGQIGQTAYAASKGGVVALTLPAARELARYGVRVATIAPGLFETPMIAGMSRDLQKALVGTVPFPPRLGRPREYAMLVKHIFENMMINGEVVRLDGALRMAPR